MIKVIFVRNPIIPDKRAIQDCEFVAIKTIYGYIEDIIKDWPDTDFAVSINGHVLEKEEWTQLCPRDGDNIVFHPIIEGGISNFFRTIFDIAVMVEMGNLFSNWGPAGSFISNFGRAAGMYVGGRIANAILPPPKQDNQQSTTYGWNGPQPTAKPGTPVAKTYGTVAVSPVLLCRFITSDGSNQYLNLLYSGGEGPVDEISNILLNGNPIQNYDVDGICNGVSQENFIDSNGVLRINKSNLQANGCYGG